MHACLQELKTSVVWMQSVSRLLEIERGIPGWLLLTLRPLNFRIWWRRIIPCPNARVRMWVSKSFTLDYTGAVQFDSLCVCFFSKTGNNFDDHCAKPWAAAMRVSQTFFSYTTSSRMMLLSYLWYIDFVEWLMAMIQCWKSDLVLFYYLYSFVMVVKSIIYHWFTASHVT